MASKPRSTRSARASRANGAKGGRPRSKLPDEVIDELGEPPADPTGLRAWTLRLLVLVQWLTVRGEIAPGLAESLRSTSGTIVRSIPHSAQLAPLEGEEGPEDDEHAGPELELEPFDSADESSGLRVER